ncbi:MAG: phenylalanine--tRNA ligase subunit beta [Kiritimatiellaeota bacterium]|nr:phenylalanine--tRNA ligase subunit beta [Kiritimatiellota bacterium]
MSEYIDISGMSVQELADKMTFAGIEIEGIDTVGVDIAGVVVGEVVACEAVPESDHLHKCRVFDGEQTVEVMCGAPNCAMGIKAPFARIGTKMPEGFTISKRKLLKKYESFGMLCSAKELGISDDHGGLMILDASVACGTPIAEVLGKPETVFTVEITWNRPDLLSIIGIAREFGALLGKPVSLPSTDFAASEVAVESVATVEVRDTMACPRYTARVIQGVKRNPSPDWMKKRLELCGQRSIDIVVDVSNYVMLECGQPLHTFDYNRIADHHIVVRPATEGETMKTLDGQERKLSSSMLLIADPRHPLAVAGVMGGEGSEIVETTTDVLLESALFDAPCVKRTATRLALRTESSHRFERGVDPNLADWASRRAAALLERYAGGHVAKGVIDMRPAPVMPAPITLRYQRVREVIGVDLLNDRIDGYLQALGIAKSSGGVPAADTVLIDGGTEASATFSVPSYRIDLVCEADLIEEVARFHGLDALPNVLPEARIVTGANDAPFRADATCRRLLANLGLHEVMHYSFLSAAELDAITPASAAERIVLPNPVSADYAVLRNTLIPQMIGTLGRNASRQTASAALFEMGRIFKSGNTEADSLCIGLMGTVGRTAMDHVRPVENEETLLWIKGILSSLSDALHAPAFTLAASDKEWALPGWGADILVGGHVVGCLGLVKAEIRHKFRVSSPMAVLEIRRDVLTAAAFRTASVQNVPAFPCVLRDIALVAPESVTHDAIIATLRKAAPPELVAITLFDIFRGKSLGDAKKSMAYSLEYRAPDRTLRDEEVVSLHDALLATLRAALPVELR